MATPDEIINEWKSLPKREAMLKLCDSITETYDMVGQIMRTHLWAEGFMNGILNQISEDYQQGSFATKQKRLFELGLIDENHNQELKILNDIRNFIAHNLYPHEKILEAIKKFPTYGQVKMPPELESYGPAFSEMGKFGLISLFLLKYLMDVFWDPKIKN